MSAQYNTRAVVADEPEMINEAWWSGGHSPVSLCTIM
jgi:hypothetical protein